jgi:hypothetical protein
VVASQTNIPLFATLATISFSSTSTNWTTDSILFEGWKVFILEILHRIYLFESINSADFSNCFGYLNQFLLGF